MGELSSLGLTPQVLHGLIGETDTLAHNTLIRKVVYQLDDGKSIRIKPQLRIWISIPPDASSTGQSLADSKLGDGVIDQNEEDTTGSLYQTKLLSTLQQQTSGPEGLSELTLTRYAY